MVDTSLSWLFWAPAIPVLAALALYPFAGVMARGISVWVALLSTLSTLGILVGAWQRELAVGNWSEIQVGGWRGARLLAEFGGIELAADPASLLLATATAIAFFVAFVGLSTAWGGGPRREARPSSAGQFLALLFLFGVVEFALLARGLHIVVGAFPIAGGLVYGVLLAARPRRDSLDATSQVFIADRFADALLLLGLGVVWVTFESFDPLTIVQSLNETAPHFLVDQGPLRGYPMQSAWTLAAGLLCAGVLLRLSSFPWVALSRRAVGAPAPILGLVHGTTLLALPLALMLKAAPVLYLSPTVLFWGSGLAALSGLLHAAMAAATKDALSVDVHLTTSLALVGAASLLIGEMLGALMVAVIVAVGPVLLAMPLSAVLESMQGQANLFRLGGLWRPLKRSESGRSLASVLFSAIPGGVGWIALCRIAWAGLASPRGNLVLFVVFLLFPIVLTFATFRSLHLQFGGDEVRGEPPANLIEVRWHRWLLPIVVSLGLLAAGVMFAAPTPLVQLLLPIYDEPVVKFISPALQPGAFAFGKFGLPTADNHSPAVRLALFVFVAIGGICGWGLSAALYRKGPSALHAKWTARGWIQLVSRALGTGLFFERAFDRVVTAPVMKGARFIVQTVLPMLIVAPPNRLPALPATAVGFVLRILHNGDVQRGLLLLVLSIAGLLWWWSIR